MGLVWSYGITTVPTRFNTTLPQTLDSLAKGGFDTPRLFIDGVAVIPEHLTKYQQTQRIPSVGAYANWVLSLWELYLRSPLADRYAIFQDDLVSCLNLRHYLEAVTYPRLGYLNLYTFPKNVQSQTTGFYRPVHHGQGALALVFNKEATKALLSFPYIVNKAGDADKSDRNIDGAVYNTMAKQGWNEFVHNPSLVQHTGETSTLGEDHNNQSRANTFMGEGFNALALIDAQDAPKTHATARVGLCGYLSATSLGKLNSAITGHLRVDRWLARPHNTKGAIDASKMRDLIIDPTGSRLEKFVRHCDVVIFCGRPCYNNLIEVCRKYNRKVVCFKTAETLDGQEGVDLWLEEPESWSRELVEDYNKRIGDLV